MLTQKQRTHLLLIQCGLSVRPTQLHRAALPYATQKGIFILLTEVVEGNNGKDKNSNYDFFLASV